MMWHAKAIISSEKLYISAVISREAFSVSPNGMHKVRITCSFNIIHFGIWQCEVIINAVCIPQFLFGQNKMKKPPPRQRDVSEEFKLAASMKTEDPTAVYKGLKKIGEVFHVVWAFDINELSCNAGNLNHLASRNSNFFYFISWLGWKWIRVLCSAHQ
jgi:hypothetical protein